MATVFRLPDHRRERRIFFSRRELDQLLQLYSRQVARGEWRDYAIDHSDGRAAFSVFRHSLDMPLYTIVKTAPGSKALTSAMRSLVTTSAACTGCWNTPYLSRKSR